MSLIRLSVLGLGTDEIEGIVGYFRSMGTDILYMEEDRLVIGLSDEIRKKIELYIFMCDLEMLIGSKLKVSFDRNSNMDVNRLIYM